jgi:hypothetical protein
MAAPTKREHAMNANVGSADRVVRIVIGVALLGLFALDSPYRWLGFVGAVPLLTAFVSFCPLYTVLGISSGSKAGHQG